MSATAQLSKLAELRAKTDRDLVRIVDNALEVALLIAATNAQGDSVGRFHGRADRIYADTLMLVSKVENLGERQRLEGRLNQLWDTLEQRLVQVAGA
jgi:hypothetical protein